MNFKMDYKDFEMLSKFITKKATGSPLVFKCDTDKKLEVKLTLQDGTDATLEFFNEATQSFPKILRKGNLGDEIK